VAYHSHSVNRWRFSALLSLAASAQQYHCYLLYILPGLTDLLSSIIQDNFIFEVSCLILRTVTYEMSHHARGLYQCSYLETLNKLVWLNSGMICIVFNPLTPELNPSVQRCLTRCFTGDFASWTVHFVNMCVKNEQMQQLFIQFVSKFISDVDLFCFLAVPSSRHTGWKNLM
jgi:hypothetical protein